jgi:hypothetical protein
MDDGAQGERARGAEEKAPSGGKIYHTPHRLILPAHIS